MSVRVLVVDDHPVVRAGLVGLLEAENAIEVVGQAAEGATALALARELAPDLVLMDLRMPVLDGVAATRDILSAVPTKVLVLTTYETDDHILTAIEAGASGYLLKAAPPEEIIAGIFAVVGGSAALSPSVAATLVDQVRTRREVTQATGSTDPLSGRELDVLHAVAEGLTNREIGQRLFIGEATVKSHLLKAFAKLGVSDRTRAVTRAQELGFI